MSGAAPRPRDQVGHKFFPFVNYTLPDYVVDGWGGGGASERLLARPAAMAVPCREGPL